MDNKQPAFLELLLEAHIGLERQGPGSPETIEQALKFLGELEKIKNIADLGCGTGGQTIQLAQHLNGNIIGLDMFGNFVDELNKKAKIKNLDNRVKGITGNMENLPFEEHYFDLIWSEGAIDNIGFQKGLNHWHKFLKKGGFIAVTCPSWLTKEHPSVVEKFWSDAGSHLDTVDKNIEIMQNCNYQFIAAFTLSENCWTDNYFYPREKSIQNLIEKYDNCDTVREYAEMNKREVELYLKYKQHYGYVFYIGKVIN